tara:strand:+ start:1414 stop:1560 length:147 start_codon:yes stop_codon:yes gene_type:complete
MKQLTYRGIVYNKGEASAKQTLKRVQGLPHTYRGAVYHYEIPKKEEVS